MTQEPKPFIPSRPVSKGAEAYHNAVVDAEYYVNVLQEYVRLAKEQIKENDLVVEFGAGTGVSASYLLKNIKINFKLWLVDNSAAWLGKAYDLFKDNPNVQCFLLEKIQDGYATLSETIGEGVADKVFSANTVHLIPDIDKVFKGIEKALKPNGIFTFQSGNIDRKDREEGVLMVDDTVMRVHDIALDIVREDDKYKSYRSDLNERIAANEQQRKFVFPKPRDVEEYISNVKEAGLEYISTKFEQIKFHYNDWMNFLKVKRLQAGILPEIGGTKPTEQEEKDRDELITKAAAKLFKELEETNPKADSTGFTAEVVYIITQKSQ